jgi:rifampicin phosphotransferase
MIEIQSLDEIDLEDRKNVGGKGLMIARLAKEGFRIPETVCIPATAYHHFVQESGLQERILLEIHRKDFKEMRWEEIWDTALRIRSMFIRKELSDPIKHSISALLTEKFRQRPVVVRSSSSDEDSSKTSFAGLHESFVNVRSTDAIIHHIKLVWASLWSDAALLYRRELNLDVEKSSMAVVVQELIFGERSGVAFSKSPQNSSEAIIESVYGLNQGLVDGMIEPDRWIMDRNQADVIKHQPASRYQFVVPASDGVKTAHLSEESKKKPPLNQKECRHIFKTVMGIETLFESPQDVEWTIREDLLYILQARAITTARGGDSSDNRGWYLSLRRTFDNLSDLKIKIEQTLIPQMIKTAEDLSKIDLQKLSDDLLAGEIDRRLELNNFWTDVYWKEFIPFAHGMRLFGEFYNDTIHPEDPYEFMDLLQNNTMLSIERNQKLERMAGLIKKDSKLRNQLENQQKNSNYSELQMLPGFQKLIDEFIEKFGDLSCSVTGGKECEAESSNLINLLLKMVKSSNIWNPVGKQSGITKNKFLSRFSDDERSRAENYLELARASYKLRDDDNIHLGRIESQMLMALQEAEKRIASEKTHSEELRRMVNKLSHQTTINNHASLADGNEVKTSGPYRFEPRQLIGQPSGPGIAKGKARIIKTHSDLADFLNGEILVCDSVDPNMTFIVPLSAGIVERRGGMLIHGAIIAREYGLPCVTGVPDVTSLITNGREITVDGYLGIVTVV